MREKKKTRQMGSGKKTDQNSALYDGQIHLSGTYCVRTYNSRSQKPSVVLTAISRITASSSNTHTHFYSCLRRLTEMLISTLWGRKTQEEPGEQKQDEDGSRGATQIINFTHASRIGLTEWKERKSVNLVLPPQSHCSSYLFRASTGTEKHEGRT